MTVLLRVLFLFLFAAAVPRLGAQSDDRPRTVPPPPVPGKLNAERGKPIAIPLGVYGAGVADMEFVIRTQPKLGKLGPVQPAGKGASVTYFPPDAGGANEDRFTYAIRTPDGVSAPAAIVITLAEPFVMAPKLTIPATLDFESIRPGQRSVATLSIRNTGGGTASGQVVVPKPWDVEGTATFDLKAGQRAEFTIGINADEPGEQTGEIQYGAATRATTTMTVQVLPPITLTPAKLDLAAKPGTATRTAMLALRNETTAPLTIAIAAPPSLLVEKTLTLTPGTTQRLAVFAEPGNVAAITGALKLSAGKWNAEVPVAAPAVAAVVRFAHQSLDFPPVHPGRPEQAMAVIENSGGTGTAISLTTSGPFRIQRTALTLPPADKAEVAIECTATEPGPAAGTLTITGDGTSASLPLRATVAAAPALAQAPPPTTPATPAAKAEPKPAAKPAPPELPEASASAQILNAGVKLEAISATSGRISWKAARRDGLRAQIRTLAMRDGALVESWQDRPATFSFEGDMARAEISSFLPGEDQIWRIAADDETQCTFRVRSPKKTPWYSFNLQPLALTLGFAILAWLGWKRWKATARGGW